MEKNRTSRTCVLLFEMVGTALLVISLNLANKKPDKPQVPNPNYEINVGVMMAALTLIIS